MADVTIRVTETGLRRVNRSFRGTERAVDRVARAGRRMGASISRGVGRATAGLGRLAGAAAGLGVALGGKAILDFDSKLARLQADAGITGDAMKAFRGRVLALQKQFVVSKDDIVGAAQVFQDLGGVLPKFLPQFGALTKVSRATGASMQDLARGAAAVFLNLGKSPKEAVDLMKAFAAQADAGTIGMRQLAPQFTVLAGLAKQNNQDILRMGAALQSIGQVSRSPEEAITRLRALTTALQQQATKLGKRGIKVFQPDGKTMRDVQAILADIQRSTKGKATGKRGLLSIFGGNVEAMQAIKALLADAGAKGGGVFGRVLAAGKGGESAIQRKLNALKTGVGADADAIKQALFSVDEAFQELGKKLINFGVRNPLLAALLGGGGFLAAKKLPGLVGKLFSRGKGTALGGMTTKPIPVYVVNAPALGGATSPAAAAGRKAGLLGKLGAAAGIVGVGAVASQAGAFAANQKADIVRKRIGAAAGKAQTAKSGALNLIQQAGQLSALGKRGATSFQGAGGQRQALTQANALKALAASAQKQGLTSEQFAALTPLLQSVLQKLNAGQLVRIKQDGLDTAKMQASRGGTQ